jgi:hypothetical protein
MLGLAIWRGRSALLRGQPHVEQRAPPAGRPEAQEAANGGAVPPPASILRTWADAQPARVRGLTLPLSIAA